MERKTEKGREMRKRHGEREVLRRRIKSENGRERKKYGMG